jgi:hypothetical protein
MSLPNYGVLIGTFNRFEREPHDDFGRWYHGFIFVNANGIVYRCAVDVNKPDGGFQYMMLDLCKNLFRNISSLSTGYHELVRDSSSGAIDYIRSRIIRWAQRCLQIIWNLICHIIHRRDCLPRKVRLWTENTGDVALNYLSDLVSDATRIYVFGAPFHNTSPLEDGMHDVHMNQGDPPGEFEHLNGIWQDGCVIVTKPNRRLRGYFGKFNTQSLHTDDNGYPI